MKKFIALLLTLALMVLTLVPAMAASPNDAEVTEELAVALQEMEAANNAAVTGERYSTSRLVPIWGDQVPYNSTASKLNDMQINYSAEDGQALRIVTALAIGHYAGNVWFDRRAAVDTGTWCTAIKPGYTKTTYEDIPALLEFPVKNAKGAVLVIPGGGFVLGFDILLKNQGESDLLAKRLNKLGYSAYVLNYRYNPYKIPVPMLDVQRAVRFLRYHAKDYGFPADNIHLLGGSAGGYLASAHVNLVQNQNLFPKGYQKDAVDKVDASVKSIGLLYPALRVDNNLGVAQAIFRPNQLNTAKKRKALCKKYDIALHLHHLDVPQFITHGTDDMLVKYEDSVRYVKAVRKAGGSIKYIQVEDANHIFTNHEEYDWVLQSYFKWLNKQNG